MWAPQRGRRNPSSDLVPRPPSPQGRRKKQFGFPLSLGERGTRKAEGAPRFACRGGEGSLPELSNFYCHPGRTGGSLNGFAAIASTFTRLGWIYEKVQASNIIRGEQR